MPTAGTVTLTLAANCVRTRAGNTGPVSDLSTSTRPATPSVTFMADTGASDSDRITSNGRLLIAGVLPGATWEYTYDSQATWNEGRGTGFTVPEDVYTVNDVYVRQTLNGITSDLGVFDAFTIDTTPPTATISTDTDDHTNTGGVTVGSGIRLNAGDTLTVLVNSDETLAADSLVDAAQFEVKLSANPPVQDLLATDTSNQYQAVYTVRPGDIGAFTLKVRNVTDIAGNSTGAAASLVIPTYTADTSAPVVTLVGEANVTVAQGFYTDAGVTTTDDLDTIMATWRPLPLPEAGQCPFRAFLRWLKTEPTSSPTP